MAGKSIANHDLPKPPEGKYPAKDHARRAAKWIAENGGPEKGVIYLEGQSTKMVEDDDQATHFRQRRNFYYLSGCDLPDSFFAYDIASDRSYLWIPPADPEYVMWAGMPLSPSEALARYDIDHVSTTDKLKTGEALQTLLSTPSTNLLVIQDRSDLSLFSLPAIAALSPKLDQTWARRAIEACRVVKDAHEIALIRHANAVSSYAHTRVLAAVKRARNERELNAVFVMHCHANGCREQAYGCICAAGSAASTLHYVHNDQPLEGKLVLLLDAGAEYNCYCADITRTFPLTEDGKFTVEAREVYELVRRMQDAAFALIKGGVLWEDCHMAAHRAGAEGLQKLGILKKELSVEEILKSEVMTRFFPHGLGHYLGMDTHDVGGNANYEDENLYFRYLRIRGKVPAGAVLTNEPGIYFRKYPLEQELKDGMWDHIIDQGVLARYWDVGGVRIEDDIWVKEGGYENLTTVKSDWESVEALVRGIDPGE